MAGSDWESCRWRPVGNSFGLWELPLETCGQQVGIGRVVVGDLWVVGLDRESCCLRDLGHRFGSGELLFDRCG
jgi:hypothetical protein